MILPFDMSNEYQTMFDHFGRVACERRFLVRNGVNGYIKLEKEIDPIVKQCTTTNHVFDMMSSIRLQQSKYGNANLYDRHWIDTTTQQKIMNTESMPETILDDNYIISIAQFNSLAEGLSAGKSVKTPFRGECVDKEYGGFTSIPHPEITLDFQQRKWRILEAIIGNSSPDTSNTSNMYDIIAIQEMDRFYGFFEPLLTMFGYDGKFVPKSNAPGVRYGWYSDGCCIFWKRNMFQMISYTSNNYSVGSSQVYLIVCMKHIATQQPLLIATTHLKSKQGTVNEDVRQKQVVELLDQLDKDEVRYRTSLGLSSDICIPTFILGDFNADLPSMKNNLSTSTIGRILQHKKSNGSELFSSAYNIDNLLDPSFFTTWKIRENIETKRIIDYIFFRSSTNVRCIATLQVPDNDVMEISRLPGLRYPSDHMLLGAKFQINWKFPVI